MKSLREIATDLNGPGTARVFFAVLLAGVIYSFAAGNYLLFDDWPALDGNAALSAMDASSFHDWVDAVRSSDSGPTGRPIAMFSFALQKAAGGVFNDHSATRRINASIHVACGLLLLWLGKILYRAPGFGNHNRARLHCVFVAAALLWVLLPLHVSTVLYPVQRMAQLSTLFVLLGLCLFAHWRAVTATQGAAPQRVAAGLCWLLLITTLATLSKENGILLLWLVVAVEVFVFRGVWRGRERRVLRHAAWGLLLLPLAGLALCLLVAPDTILKGYDYRSFSLSERLLTQTRVLWHYVLWIVFPNPALLGFAHDDMLLSRSFFMPATTALACLGWLIAFTIAVIERARRPWLLLGLVIFFIGHSLESSFLALENVFEHRNYLPAYGVCLVLAGFLVELETRFAGRTSISPLMVYAAVLALLLGVRAYAWSDEVRMAEAQVSHHPASPRARYFLSRALERDHERSNVPGSNSEVGVSPPETLLRARGELETMAFLAPESPTPYAALFLFDRRWFPNNPEEALWLSKTIALAGKAGASASDFNALRAVFARLLETCDRHAAAAEALLDPLQQSGTDRLVWDLAAYRLALCAPETGDPARILAGIKRRHPDSALVHYAALEDSASRKDFAGMYAALAAIEALDDRGQHVTRLVALIGD